MENQYYQWWMVDHCGKLNICNKTPQHLHLSKIGYVVVKKCARKSSMAPS